MTISVVTNPLAAYATNDEGFRAWGLAITDTLDDLGLTQVYSDIDWATVSMPTVVNTPAGKRVYTINDALSSTREIYISVEFCRGPSTSTWGVGFRINVIVGTTHSAGTVSGAGTMSNYFTMGATSPADGEIVGVRTDYGFSLFSNIPFTSSIYQYGFLVERLHRDGSATADGAAMMFYGTATNTASTSANITRGQIANWVLGLAYNDTGVVGWNPSALIPLGTDASYNDTLPAIPIMTAGDYEPLRIAVAAPTPPYAPANVFSAVVNGETGNYRVPYGGCSLDGTGTGAKLRLAFRVA